MIVIVSRQVMLQFLTVLRDDIEKIDSKTWLRRRKKMHRKTSFQFNISVLWDTISFFLLHFTFILSHRKQSIEFIFISFST